MTDDFQVAKAGGFAKDLFVSIMNREGLHVGSPVPVQSGCKWVVSDADRCAEVYVTLYEGKRGAHCLINKPDSPLGASIKELFFEAIGPPESLFDTYIGTDESGKGDYFGPLVVAAFVSDATVDRLLMRMGIRDCKDMKDQEVSEAASWIREVYPEQFVLQMLLPETYNERYSEYRLAGKNLQHLLGHLHASVIGAMLRKGVKVEGAVSDQFGSVLFIEEALAEEGVSIHLVQDHQAERYGGVAAASVLARDSFLSWLAAASVKVGMRIPKGSSEEAKMVAVRLGREQGPAVLRGLCKLHFQTTDKVLGLIKDGAATGGTLL